MKTTKKEDKPAKTKPGNRKETVKKSSKKITEGEKTELPGYPHYPPNEDLLEHAGDGDIERVDVESMDDLSPRKKTTEVNRSYSQETETNDETESIEGKTETDVTEEDINVLGTEDLHSDMGDDEVLKQRVYPLDMSGDDLDVPGTELDDDEEEIGEEDEENNNYSIGGDRHEDLEENHSVR